MKLSRYAPLSLSGFEPLFQGLFSGTDPFSRMASLGARASREISGIAADLFEDEGNFYVRLEMPGVKRDEVKVELDGDLLGVSFDRAVGAGEEPKGSVSYRRQISLPQGSDGGKVSAALNDGILTVTIPKAAEKKPKTIEVN